MAGFGGVAEYGITVRWNKNFLKVIRLVLERRPEFAMFGGVRFGGTLTAQEAFDMGFDHVALAAGAGRPTILDMPNGLARGVRTASDFLMALQLTGAAKADSIANMQLRLPVVVIGGGLTAVDTATESLAYYPVQVEKFLARYETLVAERGEDVVRARWNDEERSIADEFIAHAREDVPALVEMATNEADRKLLSFAVSSAELGRAILAPPGIPADRVAVLRKAFDAAMKDPELLAEVAKAKLDFEPMGGTELSKLVAEAANADPSVVDRMQKILAEQ
jgi:hypothetical protein